ncbi:MAG: TIGR04255 family protein, partial [Planctomycetes bacterium]|nr:TIGR04255 family protein [Planctomycetota bacterium]
MTAHDDPILAPLPKEVPLANAPLVRVIAQVRFPLVVAIERRDFIAPFQEAIRAKYPVLRQEFAQPVVMNMSGLASGQGQTAWRFLDVTGAWRVTLTADFLALETTSYKSRSDFLDRFRQLIVALDTHVEPKVMDRLGVRYIDRIQG